MLATGLSLVTLTLCILFYVVLTIVRAFTPMRTISMECDIYTKERALGEFIHTSYHGTHALQSRHPEHIFTR